MYDGSTIPRGRVRIASSLVSTKSFFHAFQPQKMCAKLHDVVVGNSMIALISEFTSTTCNDKQG